MHRDLIALFCSGVRFDGGGFDRDSRDAIRFLASEATLDCSLDKPFSAADIRCVVGSLFGAGEKLKPFSSTSTSDLLNCALVRFTTHPSRDPTTTFMALFTPELLHHIVREMNRYAEQWISATHASDGPPPT